MRTMDEECQTRDVEEGPTQASLGIDEVRGSWPSRAAAAAAGVVAGRHCVSRRCSIQLDKP